MATLTVAQAAAALSAAGWPAALIPVMVGIGRAESGLRVDAVSPRNRNGTVDRGWLQINSVHSQYDAGRLTSDPVYTAKAALDIYRGQGLKAWSTYNSGAYKVGVPDAAAIAAPAGAMPGSRNAPTVVDVASSSSALAGAPGKVEAAVKPFAYRGLMLLTGAGLVMAGLYRAVEPVRRQLPQERAKDALKDVVSPPKPSTSERTPAGGAAPSRGGRAGAGGGAAAPSAAASSGAGGAAAGSELATAAVVL